MQITLNIDASMLHEEVSKTLTSMSEESRQELAKQAVLKYLEEPLKCSAEEFQLNAVPLFNSEYRSSYVRLRTGSFNTESRELSTLSKEQIIKSVEFEDWYSKNQHRVTLRGLLKLEMVKTTVESTRNLVTELVTTSPEVKAMLTKVIEETKAQLPKYIEAAMTLHFTKTLGEAFSQAASSLMQAQTNDQRIQEINQRLLDRGM